ncbi:uncharacterized protein A4U43_UnF6930 [Asparagus officinalis]|uniref:pyridoxal 5'-phosphate synthase (glutamine hydrolyzing) n=1 Tax=Asparagus officinalis TaxID=4686 RepID=A0A1R3L6C4_ASPOF|nr:uncharacterized protein A4U43_UnF6930 [Asparagus officinalis]
MASESSIVSGLRPQRPLAIPRNPRPSPSRSASPRCSAPASSWTSSPPRQPACRGGRRGRGHGPRARPRRHPRPGRRRPHERPGLIKEIKRAVTIPVMAKARIGHFVEAQILEAIGVDYVDESEVLTPADDDHHINKHNLPRPLLSAAAATSVRPPVGMNE